ncbi:synaptotagmin VIII isoform X2 [Anguilla anguilla]|uniref:synaptotagmin VIII isoform X2 n=1 Tax=Anguilla anguilla TaxID=7936 RepID=UPI0015AE5454|nr:synaptotagmin VIII isoform X2 [Anguilla anguilla]
MPHTASQHSDPRAGSTATPTPAFNSTTTAPPGFLTQLLNRIPLPLWAIYAILALTLLLFLACVVCICVKCCCKDKKKRKQKKKNVDRAMSLIDVNGSSGTELVQPEVEDSSDEPKGRLLYSLEYSPHSSEVTVGVMEAAGLKAVAQEGTLDPYVRLCILPNNTKTFETKVFRSTLNPAFNEHFTFKIAQSELSRSTLVLQVFDFNRFTKHDIIGELRLQLGAVDWNHVIEEWGDLSEASDIEESFGEICFSLRYVPAAKKLRVGILEARNLKKMDLGGMADPYVKVQLILGRKKWKKKKTSVKKKTLNPYFNEMFSFDVSFDQIQRVQLVVAVWDHDKMSRNDAMGKVLLGCGATGNQLRHWADMLSNPRRPVAQWHTLLSAEQVDSSLQLRRSIHIPLIDKTF